MCVRTVFLCVNDFPQFTNNNAITGLNILQYNGCNIKELSRFDKLLQFTECLGNT